MRTMLLAVPTLDKAVELWWRQAICALTIPNLFSNARSKASRKRQTVAMTKMQVFSVQVKPLNCLLKMLFSCCFQVFTSSFKCKSEVKEWYHIVRNT